MGLNKKKVDEEEIINPIWIIPSLKHQLISSWSQLDIPDQSLGWVHKENINLKSSI